MKEAVTNAELERFLANRIKNLLLAGMNHALSCMGSARFTNFPTFASIEPANFCQLRCPECPVGMAQKNVSECKTMDVETYRSILEQLNPYIHTLQLFFQGEPLLNKQLPEMIRLSRQTGLYTIVSTNAQALTRNMAIELIRAGVNRVIVSIDGLSDESYNAYRVGGNLHTALAGLGYLHDAKKESGSHTHIELQCLRLKTNEHEWSMFKRSFRQMGADSVTLKTAQLYNYENGHPLMPSNEKYSRYKKGEDGLYHLKTNSRKICRRILYGCVVDVDGNVRPCCFDKSGKYIFGNIHEKTFSEIWFSEKANHFRMNVIHQRQTIDICQNCTE